MGQRQIHQPAAIQSDLDEVNQVVRVSYFLRPDCTQEPIETKPFQQWPVRDGPVWASFHRLSTSYLIRFPGLADFHVSGDGRNVEGYAVIGVTDETVNHLYLNQVLPLALSRQKQLVLHASAVEIGDIAVAFLGRSGLGKSTLAASFAANGLRFITDDGLLLSATPAGGYQVQPSHPSIRLWEDSRQAILPTSTFIAPPVDYTPKLRMLAGANVPFCPHPRPLSAIYVLGSWKGDQITIARIGGRDAVIELVRNCFLLDVDEHAVLRHQYQQLLRVARGLPFFRLDYPRQFDRLDEIRGTIIHHRSRLESTHLEKTIDDRSIHGNLFD